MNLKYGLSLRPYGNDSDTSSSSTTSTDDTSGSSTSATDANFDNVTVLYGFEDTDLSSGVNNEGSLADGTVTNSGVAVTTSAYYAGSQCAAFNQKGTLSNDGILLGSTSDVLGSGDFTIEGWIKGSGITFVLFSAGSGASPRFVLHFPITNEVGVVFGTSTTHLTSDGVWPSNEWFHCACVYVNATSTYSIYINGTLVLSGTNEVTRSGNAYLGQHVYTPQPRSGPDYLDEFRITKAARYSGDSFTVPDAPFPRSGSSS